MPAPAGREAPQLSVSIIMPVLNEADRITATLRRVRRDFPGCELIVVDGGSSDATPELATPELVDTAVHLVRSRPGRGTQLAVGALAAGGDVLWVMHVDTLVEPAALDQIRAALHDPAVLGGGFTLRFDRRTPSLDYLARVSNARARRLHWIFGDQAMFVRRRALDAVGGFPDLPIMEDLELSRRLARAGRLVVLPATSTASARRFTEHGTLRMLVFMQWLKLRYLVGADPATLATRYRAGPPGHRRGAGPGASTASGRSIRSRSCHDQPRRASGDGHRGPTGPAGLDRTPHHHPACAGRRLAVRLLRGATVLQRCRSPR